MWAIIERILDRGLLAVYWPIAVAGARMSIYRHERSSTKSTVLEYDGPAARLTRNLANFVPTVLACEPCSLSASHQSSAKTRSPSRVWRSTGSCLEP
ncbi:hypothetical protein V496_05931 [Pseudogymnoascus sp. VKM F-4515 (FW-2607)]|nr:hypothetical protein V496_05931 [Pseudogymnoascus sp. VKM F-4515 (FW-2607)]